MIVQSVLFFILGVATTALLLVLIAPVIWRRALYLARRVISTEVPISLLEVQADRDFLRARHAVEVVRLEEKNAALQKTNFDSRVKLDAIKEQLFRLGELEKRCLDLEDQLTDTSDELDIEKQLVAALEQSNGQNIHQLREQMFQEKLTRVDVAAQEAEIKTMRKEIERLQKMIATQSSQKQSPSIEQNEFMALRNELTNLAVTMAVKTALDEGDNSPVRQLTQSAQDNKSLAGQINKKLSLKNPRANKEKQTRAKAKAGKQPTKAQ